MGWHIHTHGYLVLLGKIGSYVGLGLPLVWHSDNCFIFCSTSRVGSFLAND